MLIPLFASPSRRFERRKGGGGGSAKGGSGSGGKSGSSSKGGPGGEESGSIYGGKGSPIPLSVGEKSSASAYGHGGGKSYIIPAGQLFAGRSAGGGTRVQIYGSRTYGSGYPGGVTGCGVAGRDFPFWFWPMVWGPGATATQPYLNGSEYGDAYNTSRFGGPVMEAAFVSNNSDPNTVFRILSDNTTITSLIDSIDQNCSSHLSSSSSKSPSPFNISSPNAPQPEQAIQYYRASSAVLTLDEYNNSATFSNCENTPDAPLPSNIDMQLLDCLNQTIGLAVPLVNVSAFLAVPWACTLVLLATIVSWILSLF